MYDLLTTALVFVLLTPGVLLSIPSSTHGDILSAFLHALVFWIVLRFLSNFVSWWVIWLVAIAAIAFKMNKSSSAGT